MGFAWTLHGTFSSRNCIGIAKDGETNEQTLDRPCNATTFGAETYGACLTRMGAGKGTEERIKTKQALTKYDASKNWPEKVTGGQLRCSLDIGAVPTSAEFHGRCGEHK